MSVDREKAARLALREKMTFFEFEFSFGDTRHSHTIRVVLTYVRVTGGDRVGAGSAGHRSRAESNDHDRIDEIGTTFSYYASVENDRLS